MLCNGAQYTEVHACMHPKSLQSCPTLCKPWTVACQALLSVGLSRQDTGVGCHALLQGIFPTQGWILGLLHCRWILHCLSHQGSPMLPGTVSDRAAGRGGAKRRVLEPMWPIREKPCLLAGTHADQAVQPECNKRENLG